ncbi:hypothetical protein AVEN_5705-1, partial [Araneus ventricosus]
MHITAIPDAESRIATVQFGPNYADDNRSRRQTILSPRSHCQTTTRVESSLISHSHPSALRLTKQWVRWNKKETNSCSRSRTGLAKR